MKLSRLIGGAAAAVLLTAGAATSAHAASITVSNSFDFVSPPEFLFAEASRSVFLNDTSGQRSGILSLSLFNPVIGTLNQVSLTVRQRVGSQFEDIGGNCTPSNPTCFVNMTRTADLTARYSAGTSVNRGLGGQFIFDPSTCELGGTGTDSCAGFQDYRDFMSGSTRHFTDAADLSDFLGTGNFTVESLMTTTLGVSPGSGGDVVSVVSSFDWSVEVSVTYDFTEASTEIPAPAGAAFLLIGLAALTRRKRD